MKYLLISFLFLFSIEAAGQSESVHLHLDKVIAYPGDTVWFRGFVFDHQVVSNRSTKLYVELYRDSTKLALREIFPLYGGFTAGQLPLPQKPGLYWLRAYTRNSRSFLVSLTIRDPEKPLLIRRLDLDNDEKDWVDTCGLSFRMSNTEEGLLGRISQDSVSRYSGQPFILVAKYYDSVTGKTTFTLPKGHNKLFQLQKDSLNPYLRGYATLEYYNTDTLVARTDVFLPQKEVPVRLVLDTGGYRLQVDDSLSVWNYSLSVSGLTDSMGAPDIRNALKPPAKPLPTDTAFLDFQGSVLENKRHGHLLKNTDLVVLIGKDSAQHTQLLTTDSLGKLTLGSMYFFDSLDVNFMVNGSTYTRPEEINWTVERPSYPPFIEPEPYAFNIDMLKNPPGYVWPVFDTVKYLKAAIVTERYADRNKAIDARYTKGTRFDAPAHFSFDMTKADLRYPTDIVSWLNGQLPFFMQLSPDSAPKFKGKPCTFYLEGQLTQWKDLKVLTIKELAYVKVIEDFVDDSRFIRLFSQIDNDKPATFANPTGNDNAPSCMICIYRRAGKDLRAIPGRMSHVSLKGFDRPLSWSKADKTTVLWMPYVRQNEHFLIPGSAWKHAPYRLTAEGVSQDGRTFHFEKTIP